MGVSNSVYQTLHGMSPLWTFASKYSKTNTIGALIGFWIYPDITSLKDTLEIVGDWCIRVVVSNENLEIDKICIIAETKISK